jgi:hypothetical protein
MKQNLPPTEKKKYGALCSVIDRFHCIATAVGVIRGIVSVKSLQESHNSTINWSRHSDVKSADAIQFTSTEHAFDGPHALVLSLPGLLSRR